MKVWITKYALTGTGIFEANASEQTELQKLREEIEIPQGQGPAGTQRCYGPTAWHESLEEAVETANAMRTAEIRKLKQRITELEGMVF